MIGAAGASVGTAVELCCGFGGIGIGLRMLGFDVIKAYDVALKQKPDMTDRTSYVIDRSGKIVFVHSDLDWSQHVAKTLAAVKGLKR